MIQKDFILKYLETFSNAIGEMLSGRKNNRLDESLRAAKAAMETDGEAADLYHMPLSEFLDHVDFMENFDARKWVMAADILFEEAEIRELKGEKEVSVICFIKTLHLVLEAILSDPETYRPKEVGRIGQIVAHIGHEALPQQTLRLYNDFQESSN